MHSSKTWYHRSKLVFICDLQFVVDLEFHSLHVDLCKRPSKCSLYDHIHDIVSKSVARRVHSEVPGIFFVQDVTMTVQCAVIYVITYNASSYVYDRYRISFSTAISTTTVTQHKIVRSIEVLSTRYVTRMCFLSYDTYFQFGCKCRLQYGTTPAFFRIWLNLLLVRSNHIYFLCLHTRVVLFSFALKQ